MQQHDGLVSIKVLVKLAPRSGRLLALGASQFIVDAGAAQSINLGWVAAFVGIELAL